MSLGTKANQEDANDDHLSHPPSDLQVDSFLDSENWTSFRGQILENRKSAKAVELFGGMAENGGLYRWGLAVACGDCVPEHQYLLSRLASDQPVTKREFQKARIGDAASDFLRINQIDSHSVLEAVNVNLWAAGLPQLLGQIPDDLWWNLVVKILDLRESTLSMAVTENPVHLIVGAELGVTLAWRLGELPSCARLAKSGMQCMAAWYESESLAISAAIQGGTNARLVLASAIRAKLIAGAVSGIKLKKQQTEVLADLATWVSAMTLQTGSSAFSVATKTQVQDDTVGDGLLDQVALCDEESLIPATHAALGNSQNEGRLAWEVSLPESMQNSDDAKIAVLMPQWDVRRGRIHADYSEKHMCLEIFAGKPCVIQGVCETTIELDGNPLRPVGEWSNICDYSDDDVHYLELEQPWSKGYFLQRQLMVVRDDRCSYIADTVVPGESHQKTDAPNELRYRLRLPMTPMMHLRSEPETSELFFSDGKDRGLVLPLSANEWRIGASATSLTESVDQHLELSVRGVGALYAPLWFDFQRKRFARNRTWRQLTVAHDLRICGSNEAVGYRIQVGTEQWMMYRSIFGRACRTVLGKHLVADFFASRFHGSDGLQEELITVDDDTDD